MPKNTAPLKHSPSPWRTARIRDGGTGYVLRDAEGRDIARIELVAGHAQPGDLLLITHAPAMQERAAHLFAQSGQMVLSERTGIPGLCPSEEELDEATVALIDAVRLSAGLPEAAHPRTLDDDLQREYVSQLRALVPPKPPTPEPADGEA
jgi:hypothetical protein